MITSLYYEADQARDYSNICTWLSSDDVDYKFKQLQLEKDGKLREALAHWLNHVPVRTNGQLETLLEGRDLDLWDAYNAYKRLVKQQKSIFWEEIDVEKLTSFLQSCPKLDSIHLTVGRPERGGGTVGARLHSEAHFVGNGYHCVQTAGLRHINSICYTLQTSGRQLKRFSAGDIGCRLLTDD